jgi:GNAT superfamily N-acetyltransferase
MHVERFDPLGDPEKVRACYEIFKAGAPVDFPGGPVESLPAYAGWLAMGWAGTPYEAWLAAAGPGGDWVAFYRLELPAPENRHLGLLWLFVHPDHRRAGLGRALLRHAAERSRQDGRTELIAGARQGVTEVLRVLDLADLSAPRRAELRAQAERASTGYSVLSWTGPCPEQYVEQFAAVCNAIADAPHSPGYESMEENAGRIRSAERRLALQGMHQYTVVARCDATGDLAGMTQISVDPLDPGWGFQGLTAVAREHRGHRLGLLVKAVMLDLLAEAEPGLERIITGNAGSNQFMIAINADLGFHVFSHWPNWQIDVAQVLDGQAAQQSASAGAR